jgi:acetamidase/formamidase
MARHRLTAADESIHYAWDARLAPVLEIDSGDEVVVETRSGEDDQLQPGDSPDAIDRFDRDRLHALSGPIGIRGAEPGALLAVRMLELTPGPWGFLMQRPGGGLIRGFDPYLRFFDLTGRVVELARGVQVPIRPFLGVMGVASAVGSLPTEPPGDHGGNLDCADLVAGTTLYLPVQVPGALFSCGDGHAAQGDGEVCVTAVECKMTSRLRFDVLPGDGTRRPRAETPSAYMTMGSGPTVEDAARQALDDMLTLICRLTDLDRADAYALAGMAVDIRINQVVNEPMMGVRAVLPKAVVVGEA